MTQIIPSTDLRNRFAEVEQLAKDTREPIYLTKNGRGSLVLMDIDAFDAYVEERAYRCYLDAALEEAARNKAAGQSRYQTMELAFEELLSEPPAALSHRLLHGRGLPALPQGGRRGDALPLHAPRPLHRVLHRGGRRGEGRPHPAFPA